MKYVAMAFSLCLLTFKESAGQEPIMDNPLTVEVKKAIRCKYDRELLLSTITLRNVTDDTVFVLKNQLDNVYVSMRFNNDDNWPSNKLVIYNLPTRKILPEPDGIVDRSPAVFFTKGRGKGLLKPCYVDFPAANFGLPTKHGKELYYIINPKCVITVASTVAVESNDLSRIGKLTKAEKQSIAIELGFKTRYYTNRDAEVKSSFQRIKNSTELNKAFISILD